MEQLQMKMIMDEQKHRSMINERTNMNQIRTRTLVDAEIQREHIKNALYHMSVWNTFDPNIITHIITASSSNAIIQEKTVDELVRKTAMSMSQKKRRRIIRSSSTADEYNPRSTQMASTHGGTFSPESEALKGTQNQFQSNEKQVKDERDQ